VEAVTRAASTQDNSPAIAGQMRPSTEGAKQPKAEDVIHFGPLNRIE